MFEMGSGNSRLRQRASARFAIVPARRASQGGQSLLELLLAIGISALLIGGAAAAIALALNVNTQSKPVQGALFITQGLADKAAALAEEDWIGNMDGLSAPPATYYVTESGGAFSVTSGSDTAFLDDIMYTRYFTAESVYRDAGGIIAPTGTLDPSTKKITANAAWSQGAGTTQFTVVKYVTRSRNISTGQTDWSGGAGQSGGFSASDKYDAADAGIDASAPGVVKLRLQ